MGELAQVVDRGCSSAPAASSAADDSRVAVAGHAPAPASPTRRCWAPSCRSRSRRRRSASPASTIRVARGFSSRSLRAGLGAQAFVVDRQLRRRSDLVLERRRVEARRVMQHRSDRLILARDQAHDAVARARREGDRLAVAVDPAVVAAERERDAQRSRPASRAPARPPTSPVACARAPQRTGAAPSAREPPRPGPRREPPPRSRRPRRPRRAGRGADRRPGVIGERARTKRPEAQEHQRRQQDRQQMASRPPVATRDADRRDQHRGHARSALDPTATQSNARATPRRPTTSSGLARSREAARIGERVVDEHSPERDHEGKRPHRRDERARPARPAAASRCATAATPPPGWRAASVRTDSRAELPPDPVRREPREPATRASAPHGRAGSRRHVARPAAMSIESGRELDGRGAGRAPRVRREIAVAARDPDGSERVHEREGRKRHGRPASDGTVPAPHDA